LKSVYNSWHLNQKGKKKKSKKRYRLQRESWAEKRKKKKEEEGRRRDLGRLDWIVGGSWRRQKQWAKA
jgi:hypothetical protein